MKFSWHRKTRILNLAGSPLSGVTPPAPVETLQPIPAVVPEPAKEPLPLKKHHVSMELRIGDKILAYSNFDVSPLVSDQPLPCRRQYFIQPDANNNGINCFIAGGTRSLVISPGYFASNDPEICEYLRSHSAARYIQDLEGD
jgi:hypothetical protein